MSFAALAPYVYTAAWTVVGVLAVVAGLIVRELRRCA